MRTSIDICVAHRYLMNAIDGNLLFGQIANDCIGHVLRILNTGLPACVGVASNFYDVTLLSLKLSGNLA